MGMGPVAGPSLGPTANPFCAFCAFCGSLPFASRAQFEVGAEKQPQKTQRVTE